MSIVALCYSIPYLLVHLMGYKPAYHLKDFILITGMLPNTAFVTILLFAISSAIYLIKPQNRSEWEILQKHNPKTKRTLSLNSFIVGITEEFVFRYILFYSITSVTSQFTSQELINGFIFVFISSHLFSKTHRSSNETWFYIYYFIVGFMLGLTFLLTGLVATIIIHLAFNATVNLTRNYYLTHPVE